MELTVKAASFKKIRWKYEKEGNSFAKLKSTIMIIGQRDSEAGEVEKSWRKEGGK